MYELHDVMDRTEPCHTPACISLDVDISPSTITLNYLFEKKGLMNLIIVIKNFNFDNRQSKPEEDRNQVGQYIYRVTNDRPRGCVMGE